MTSSTELKELLDHKELFIFDLDGTMFNSLGDLAPAVNYALKAFGVQQISKDNVRSCIGNGSRNLIRRSVASGLMFAAGKTAGEPIAGKSNAEHLDVRNAEAVAAVLESAGFDEAKIDEVLKTYSNYYWEHCTEDTEPYEGVIEIIKRINALGKNAAMLTNKPELPAKKILAKFGLIGGESADLISAYLCGDTSPERKPSPAGIFAIMNQFGIAAEKAVMIGDDTPDVMAAKNAGIDSIICLKGFGRPENLLPLEPKYTAGHIKDFAELL
ncbi:MULTISPECIES: HAD family hydrolase [unclassified Fibrobacter]|uniref:HAD family hydrolase n=1 Tax=unclassified Fibrobacter TaxID=2634177 RepID=UPI000D6CDBE5|nr:MULTISPECIES: HAD-IA family hydrolase [unclassified Fibrobacter]PWJ65536.1 phosphoglycolate phosphatase [Fibrobacter sp. UWR4]PZW72301.1 phosphoglycolate phosphatase [Fibrobacter sp. UWR1]